MSDDKKIEDKPKVFTAQNFADEYDQLCKKTGFRVVASPAFIARDDGTFSLVIQYSAGQLPKK